MLKTKILLPDGTVLSSGLAEQHAIVSASLTQRVNDQTELSAGSVCSSMLEATVFSPEGALRLDVGTEVSLFKDDVLMGLYTLEKPNRSSANTLKLTACDRVSWLDRDLSEWLESLTQWPYSLYQLAKMVCQACGLTLANEELPNGSYLVQQFSASGITGRQLMQWIGEVAGRFCRATADGKLEFAWYAPAPVSIGTTALTDHGQGTVAVMENVPSGAVLQPVTQITGETDKVTLLHTGKNLFDIIASTGDTKGSYYDAENDWITSVTATRREYVYVTITQLWQALKASGKNITFSFDIRTAVEGTVRFYTLGGYSIAIAGGTFSATTQWQHKTFTVKSSALSYKENDPNGERCSLSWYGTYDTGVIPFIKNLQIEISDVETDYEPYQGQTLAVQLPEAVTQGSYDWSSGVLTVDEQRAIQLPPICIPALMGDNILFSGQGTTAVSYRQLGCYQNSLKYEDYTVSPIEKVQIRLTDSDVGAVYPDTAGGNTYVISGNYLLSSDTGENLLPIAKALYEQLKEVTYTPCQVSVPGDLSLQAGQVVTVTDRGGHSFRTYIMERSLSGHRDRLKSTGSASRGSTGAVNNQSFQALNGKVLELRTEIEGLKAENRDTAGKAASLALDVEGIKAEVSRQESDSAAVKQQLTTLEQTAQQVQLSVQSIEQNGVTKVQTGMGYTFDDTGLHISKTDSNLENAITETGMYVKRSTDGAVMLQADANGVIATDVSVRNYLIVGNARFEEYTGGRTACFYFGG